VGTLGSGNGGRISISTPALNLDDKAFISSGTEGTGHGGNIQVQVGTASVANGAQISGNSFSTGRGGNVTVAATEQIELSTGGTISASSSGKGDAGSIVIQAGNIFRSRNGAVTTEAEQADGGNIQLTVGSLVDLRDSQLTATVQSGVGKGGNITIDARFVILEGSQIRADAFGGPGGNVRIVSDVFLRDPASLVSASSARGIQGTVDIRAPVTSLSGAVAPLPQAFVSAAALLPARCAARLSGGRYSSLVVGGPDGLPLDPGSVLPSPLTLDESVGDPAVDGTPHQQKPPAKFALLTVVDKVFPRLHWGNAAWGCSK
jgi:large exoprotein involved in heme utilization and adhesion